MDKYEMEDDWLKLTAGDLTEYQRRIQSMAVPLFPRKRMLTMMAEANYGVAIRPFAEKAEEAIGAHSDGFALRDIEVAPEHQALLDALALLPEAEPVTDAKAELTAARDAAWRREAELLDLFEKAGAAVFDAITKARASHATAQ